jgi:hypothetical protein
MNSEQRRLGRAEDTAVQGRAGCRRQVAMLGANWIVELTERRRQDMGP